MLELKLILGNWLSCVCYLELFWVRSCWIAEECVWCFCFSVGPGSELLIDWYVQFLFPSELLTSNVGSKLCESTFLPTSPLPFPSHPTEVVCGNFQSAGWILEGNSLQKGNPDKFLLSLCAAACSAPEKFRRRLLYWDYWDFLDERERIGT